MPSYSMSVTNGTAWERALAKRTKRVESNVKRTVGKHVTRVHRDALKRAPRGKTNDVAIKLIPEFDADKIIGYVKDDSTHAVYPELGTGERGANDPPANNQTPKGELPEGMSYDPSWPGMAARPYLVPALEADRASYNSDLADDLKEGMRGE